MFENKYVGISKLTRWSVPPVEIHRAYFCLQVKSVYLKNLKLKCSLILSQWWLRSLKSLMPVNLYEHGVQHSGVPYWKLYQLTGLCCKPLFSLSCPASLSALHSWSVIFPAVAWEQSIALMGLFHLWFCLCYHHFQLFPNIFSVCMKKRPNPKRYTK